MLSCLLFLAVIPMLKIKEAVIVEGRYDKLKLSNILDTLIIETNGFGIYKNKDKLEFIKRLAEERGIIIITDSDHSGFQIRNFISAGIPKEQIKHIYIPDVYGKEKRKNQPSKEGKIGVEGMDDKLLKKLFENADIDFTQANKEDPVKACHLYELGITGVANAAENKKKLLKALSLPEFLSTKALLSYINSSMTKDEFFVLANSVLNN